MLNLVGKLSNIPDSFTAAGDDLAYGPAAPHEYRAGLSLLLAAGQKPAGERQIDEFLRFADQRRIDPGRVWVARERGRIVWALLPIISPGRTALLMTPSELWPVPAAPRLIDAAGNFCQEQGVSLVQLLLDPKHPAGRELPTFRRVAELNYLQSAVRRREAVPLLPPGMRWETYSPQSHAAFLSTISASYRESLDCPALAGLRDMEDVVTGHKAAGQFDPHHWFLLRRDEQPAGVLLLNRMTGSDAAELTYLGVPPEFRRHGIGQLLVRQALAATAAMGAQTITLAVDSANTPALRLYHRHGFRHLTSRLAIIRAFAQPSGGAVIDI
jgi:ribosomal protein S18 acetylase RimI-like enzyme